jgi:putative methyltransferase (TIGR04325 family)
MAVRQALRRWLPPAVLDGLRAIGKRKTVFSRACRSWEDAAKASSGYDAENVLQRVLASARKVRDGTAAYERDSVLFNRIEYSFPVLATLLRAAIDNGGALTVIDFGGALGSSFRECRSFLGNRVSPLRWSVVEQPTFVEAGRREMQTEELRFCATLQEAAQRMPVEVLLFSGVLQYLPEPYATIDEGAALGARYIVIDRTIMSDRPHDSIHVQFVPRTIYAASYPVWVLSMPRVVERLRPRYDLLSVHDSLPFPDLGSITAKFKGLIFKARDD